MTLSEGCIMNHIKWGEGKKAGVGFVAFTLDTSKTVLRSWTARLR